MMKILRSLLAIALLGTAIPPANAQDTIMYANGQRIIGQVEEILREQVRYRTSSSGATVIVVADKSELAWIHLAGGQRFEYRSVITGGPSAMRRNVLAIDLFAPALDHVTISYERHIRQWMSIVVKAGRIGIWNKLDYGDYLESEGFLLKAGPKFVLPGQRQDRHSLAGWYLRPELIFSYWAQNGYWYTPGPWPDTVNKQTFRSSAALNLVLGHQFFIGERFSMDFNAGLGYGISWQNGIVPDPVNNGREPYSFSHTFFAGGSPLCVSGGVLMGYLF